MNDTKTRLTLFAITLAVSFAGCTQAATVSQQSQPAGENVVITEGSNGQTVNVRVGSEVVIQLSAQMGTGYSWQLLTKNSKVAVPMGNPELKSKPGQAPGAAEQQLFRFKIESQGSVTLKFQYIRVWEKDKPPQKTFEVTLRGK